MKQVGANSYALRSEARAAARMRLQRAQSIDARYPIRAHADTPESIDTRCPTRAHAGSNTGLLMMAAFVAVNVLLAFLVYRYAVIATLHGLAALAVGMYWAGSGRQLQRVAYVGAYIAGSEVLWRMSDSQLFWEFGKYATAAIFIVAMVRSRHLKIPTLPLIYFALLIPSAALTMALVDMDRARQLLSFNLSGPFALMASAWFFSYLKLSKEQLQRLFLALMGPIIGIGAVTLIGTVTAVELKFTDESNFMTSGGFGPNQVSAALGLGVLVALFHVLDGKASWSSRIFMFGGMVFLAIQSAMTFSRGGLYTAAGSAVLASIYLIRDPRSRFKFILAVALLFVLAQYVVIPRLDEFTGGALSARFENTDTSHRGEIALEEINVWMENPLFGAGPGLSHPGMAAHTEFSRLLAEHGTFGLTALIVLFIMGVQNLKRSRTSKDKAVVASMVGWGILYMLDKGMRLAAPSLTFGLSFATLLPEENVGPSARNLANKLDSDLRLDDLKHVTGRVRGWSPAVAARSRTRETSAWARR